MLIAVDNRPSSPDALCGSGRTVSDTDMRKRSGPIQLNRMEVSVRTDYEQYPTSQTSSGSFVGKELQGHCKAHEVSLDVDVESGQEK
jgi:hypothetical protein